MMPKLTARQARFVDLYVADGNGASAAERAGFSAKGAKQVASRLLTNVDVRAAIEERRRGLVEKAGVTAEAVVAELKKIGFADIRKVVSWADGVVGLVDSDKVDAATAGAISSVSQGKDGEIKIRFHSKEAALVNLGKHLGLFRDQEGGGAPVIVNIVDPRSNVPAKK